MKEPSKHQPLNGRFATLLDAIPDAAMLIRPDRRVIAANQKFRSIFSGGEEVHGRYCYEVSHCRDQPCDGSSEMCPLDRCLETRDPVHTLHVHSTADGDVHTAVLLRPLIDETGEPESFLEVMRPLRIASATASRERLVGRSPVFNRMLEDLDRFGPTEKPVSISGEAGTGKELIAVALHDVSPRRHRPFIPVDCAALHEWQFERQLFGHAKGAFPGADEARNGFIGAALGGSLFLKEIDALSSAAQVRLVRLLETDWYTPEGSTQPLRADFRLICSSKRNLDDLARAGSFRDDLRLRIGGFPIEVPPLRERVEDIPILVQSLLSRLECLQPCPAIDPSAMERLKTYAYPGNIRELIHILERACLTAEGNVIRPEHLPPDCQPTQPRPGPELAFKGEIVPLRELETLYIEWAANRSVGSQRALARQLGVSERTIYRKLQRVRNALPHRPPERSESSPPTD